jgi:hypothetical protein
MPLFMRHGAIEPSLEYLADRGNRVIGEFSRRADAKIEKLRAEMRDNPPLFSAPDKKLSAAMVRVGEEMHGLREGVEAARSAVADCAKRSDLGAARRRVAELQERNEAEHAAIQNNLRAVNGQVFNLANKLERMYELLVRFAAAADCAHVLNSVDRSKLSQDEEKNSGVVLRLEDLRRSA